MKAIYTLVFTSLLGFSTFSQVYQNLDFNNVNSIVSNSGIFFNNGATDNHGYEVPAGSGNHILYALAFWFGGEDINGQLKLSAQTYTHDGDQFTGPLTTGGSAEYPASSADYTIYPMKQSIIDYHIENYDEVGYEIPSTILDWPAHGDVASEVDYYLAPFVDVDSDGVYDPSSGDYPKIKGQSAVYIITNDKADIHESGGAAIGLELHYLIYQYATDDYLNNTTFINLKIINRGTQTIYGFRTGCWADSDLGYYYDDHVGFNEENNVMFAYNGDNFDEGGAGQPGYGENPPAMGVVLLNQGVRAFATSLGGTGGPSTPADYYNYMGAIWPDGTHFTEGELGAGGDEETNFLYNGNPNIDGEWTEPGVGNPPGDRRMMMSVEEAVLSHKEVLCYDYAILYSRDGNNIENVQGVIDQAAAVKAFYDADEDPYCTNAYLSLGEEKSKDKLKIYPNPSTGSFRVETNGAFDIALFALDGRRVYSEMNKQGNELISPDLAAGTYVVQVKQDTKMYQMKLIFK